mmetsp:Transcript_3134/g.7557  ORF Transcript_3134/g.7557 Transcript_3134/m.7557 type:complete len:244 (-) Transcript_3134:731-1462(-)
MRLTLSGSISGSPIGLSSMSNTSSLVSLASPCSSVTLPRASMLLLRRRVRSLTSVPIPLEGSAEILLHCAVTSVRCVRRDIWAGSDDSLLECTLSFCSWMSLTTDSGSFSRPLLLTCSSVRFRSLPTEAGSFLRLLNVASSTVKGVRKPRSSGRNMSWFFRIEKDFVYWNALRAHGMYDILFSCKLRSLRVLPSSSRASGISFILLFDMSNECRGHILRLSLMCSTTLFPMFKCFSSTSSPNP